MKMEVDQCGSWVTKRNLNLENFIRNLGKEVGFPRYYETCALESKGALSLRNVVLTDTALFFTENVPKNVLLFIPLKDIRNIEVVADRKALLKSGKTQQCICQHVQLHCTSVSSNFKAVQIQPTDSKQLDTFDTSGKKSTTPIPPSSAPPDSDSSFTDFSRQSSRLEGTLFPSSLLEAYESPVVPTLPTLLFGRSRAMAGGSTSSSSSSTHFGDRGSGGFRENTRPYFNHHQSRRNWSESGSASELDVSISGRRNEIMEEEKLDEINRLEKEKPRPRPRSLDMNHVSSLIKQKMLRLVLGDNSFGLAKSLPPPTVSLKSRENQGIFVDFYLYRPNSVMLNELFLFWNRQRLKTLLGKDVGPEDGKHLPGLRAAEKAFSKLSNSFNNRREYQMPKFQDGFLSKLATAHKALVQYNHLPRILWKDWTMITHFLELLKSCITSENREEEDEDSFVDRLFSIVILMDIFRHLFEATGPSWFLKTSTDNNNNRLRNNNQISSSTEEEKWSEPFSTSPGNARSQPSSITSLHELTSILVRLILCSPDSILPPTSPGAKGMVKEIVCKPRKFAEGRWLCSTDTKVIKAVSLVHNSSVALLHEILSIVHFSPKDKKRAKFMSCLQDWPMESFLQLSMTQILNLLWDNGEILGTSQSVMLFRLVHTTQTLTTYYVPSMMQFLRHNFSEEFRYFIHEDSANKKILDRYPLKPALSSMCEQLRQEIIDK